ncbi:hypothetical protein LLY42_25340 [Pseudomonas frederiksbergensis]|nr:hypothetical protein LLY42_25340 [Pseudomonas frederiksbergensis]
MINQKYALNPEAQLEPLELILILSKFGLSEGRFISRLPDGWRQQVIHEFEKRNLSTIEMVRIRRNLQSLKERGGILNISIEYNKELTWLKNAFQAKSKGLIDDIISDDASHGLSAKDIIDSDSLHECRDTKITWTADEMINVAMPLLSLSEEIYIVDRFIQLRSKGPDGYLTFFKKIIEATQSKKIKLIIYCAQEGFNQTDSEKNLREKISPLLSSRQSIEFFLLPNYVAPHERFIISIKGGIYFDKGFHSSIDPNERHLVGYYSKSAHEQQWKDFVENRSSLKIEKHIKIPG